MSKAVIAATAVLLASSQPAFAGPSETAPIMLRDSEAGKDFILVGIIAHGGDANLDKLEAAAREAGAFPADRTHKKGPTVGDTMVVFRPGSDPKRLRAFYDRASAMDFGFVLIDVMVVAPQDAADGITSSDVKVRELADFEE